MPKFQLLLFKENIAYAPHEYENPSSYFECAVIRLAMSWFCKHERLMQWAVPLIFLKFFIPKTIQFF